jgi:N12 class adenine-specific DNA methylase
LQSIIEHCKLSHGEETLKYRQLVLDENTGIQIYQTKIHEGVVPSNLTKYGKCITVNDPTFHCIITRGPLCPISCTRCYKKIDVALETASQKPIF